MTNTSVHLTQLIIKSVQVSIHAHKLCHDVLESHTARRRRRSGADVDGAVEAGGIAILNHLKCSYASLHLTVATSMAHMTWKWSETRKGTKK